MNFAKLVQDAPEKTVTVSYRELFDTEILITSNKEIRDALAAADEKPTQPKDGEKSRQDVLDEFLASKVKGLKGLTLKKAMTLCGRELPKEAKAKAKEPLTAERETVLTLINLVVGYSHWLMNQVRESGQIAARREEELTKN